MTATLAIDEFSELRAENARLHAQVIRLQNFAFRDLLELTDEELSGAIAELPADQRASMRRLLNAGTTVPASTPTGPANTEPSDEQRADAWRRTFGLLPPLPKHDR